MLQVFTKEILDIKYKIRNYIESKLHTLEGWGKRSYSDQLGSNALLEVTVPIWKIEDCRTSYQSIQLPITDNHICAGYKEGGKDSCSVNNKEK